MSFRKKLFHCKQVYDIESTNELFLNAMKEVVEWHYEHCREYRTILSSMNFTPDVLKRYEDIHCLPPIPTLYLKQHSLLSVPPNKLHFKSTTSGTSGNPVEVGLDIGALLLGVKMLRKMVFHHNLPSLCPANYLILGYQPAKHNTMGAVRTAYASTFLTPFFHKEYALKDTGEKYTLDIEGVSRTLYSYSRRRTPVRIIGFPAYLYFLLKKLEEAEISLNLSSESMILIGGGWKQFASQEVNKQELHDLADKWLGIKEGRFKEFFGVVEHNIPYFTCANHHFHVPVYSRVIIRDVKTMAPLGFGTPGILNLITPFLKSMPLVSIMTDDIAVLREGQDCGCGNAAPFFTVLGRAGLSAIKTCAAGAGSILEASEDGFNSWKNYKIS